MFSRTDLQGRRLRCLGATPQFLSVCGKCIDAERVTFIRHARVGIPWPILGYVGSQSRSRCQIGDVEVAAASRNWMS
jgi:hypothetical protein